MAPRGAAQWPEVSEAIARSAGNEPDDAVQSITLFEDEEPIEGQSSLRYPCTRFALPSSLPPPRALSKLCRVVHAGFQAIGEDDETLEYPGSGTWTAASNRFRDAPSADLPFTLGLPSLSALGDALIGRKR